MPGLTWFFKLVIRPWSNFNALAGEPSDEHTHKIANLILQDSEQRLRLTDGIFMPKSTDEEGMGRIEAAFKAVKQAEDIEKKVRKAVKDRLIQKTKGPALYQAALDKGIINQIEMATLQKAAELALDAIQVDDFSQEEYLSHGHATASKPGHSGMPIKVSAPNP